MPSLSQRLTAVKPDHLHRKARWCRSIRGTLTPTSREHLDSCESCLSSCGHTGFSDRIDMSRVHGWSHMSAERRNRFAPPPLQRLHHYCELLRLLTAHRYCQSRFSDLCPKLIGQSNAAFCIKADFQRHKTYMINHYSKSKKEHDNPQGKPEADRREVDCSLIPFALQNIMLRCCKANCRPVTKCLCEAQRKKFSLTMMNCIILLAVPYLKI